MNKLISAIIVDDEKDARDGFEKLLIKTIPNISVLAKAQNAQNALEIIIDKNPDIIFLDIQMPINDGFWLAEKINKLQIASIIIFVTAYDEYAIKAIKYSAFDFLTKPIIPEVLIETVRRFQETKEKYNLNQKLETLKLFLNHDRIKLNTKTGFIRVATEDIIYCDANGNDTNLYLTNGKSEIINFQIGAIEEKLNNKNFVRISQSTIINLTYLENFNRKSKTVILSDILQKYEFTASSKGCQKLMKT